MDVPSLEDAERLCRGLSALIDQGRSVVLHCKAGLGRTGTMLACALVYRGENAVQAVHRVRSVNPLYIQSDRQLAFIPKFEHHLRGELRPS
jgi:atypical dual specificity phosphatase